MAVCQSYEEVTCGTVTSLRAKLPKSLSQREFVLSLLQLSRLRRGGKTKHRESFDVCTLNAFPNAPLLKKVQIGSRCVCGLIPEGDGVQSLSLTVSSCCSNAAIAVIWACD